MEIILLFQKRSKHNEDQKAIQIVAEVSVKYQHADLCTQVKISHMKGYGTNLTDSYMQYVDLNNSGCADSDLIQRF